MTHFIQTCKSTDPKEELLNDLDTVVKETKLTIETLSKIKQTITDNPILFQIPSSHLSLNSPLNLPSLS